MLVLVCSTDLYGTILNRTKFLECDNILQSVAIDTAGEERVVRLRDFEKYVKIVGASVCASIDLTVICTYFLVWEKQSCYGWSVTAMTISLTIHHIAGVLDGKGVGSCFGMPATTLSRMTSTTSTAGMLW